MRNRNSAYDSVGLIFTRSQRSTLLITTPLFVSENQPFNQLAV